MTDPYSPAYLGSTRPKENPMYDYDTRCTDGDCPSTQALVGTP